MELQAAVELEKRPTRPAWDDSTEWLAVHRRLRAYSRHRATLDAAEAYDLVRAEQMKLHLQCGFVTIYEYMERELGYGPHVAHERMRVARALAPLPPPPPAPAPGRPGDAPG